MAYLKPASEITDRAKRLRANKIHKLKKRCEECPSKRNLGVGHRDGDESNNRPSNLFTQCKSCNGKQTARDIKAGRGVRTRQYNPGAINLAQYVQAAMDHVRGSHDAAGKVLHETPKSVRRAFAKEIWWRRGYRGNPPRDIMPEFWAGKLKDSHGKTVKTVEQARAILLSELRALGKIPARNPAGPVMDLGGDRWQVDNGHGTTLTLIRKSQGLWEVQGDNVRSRAAWRGMAGVHTFNSLAEVERSYKAFRGIRSHVEGNLRRNPSEADELYRKFHGRGPDKIYEMQVRGIDPYGGHPELTSLGPLIRFIVGEGVVLGGEYGDEVEEADWVCELPFVPSPTRWHDWLERANPPVAEAKARLREWKTPDLAAVPNTKQLYILGKQNLTAEQLNAVGADPEKDLLDLGSVYLVEYFTQKRFDRFEPINYFHHFSEVSKSGWPRLIYDRVHGLLSLAGGEYRVTPRGIEN